jgi:predicted TIM-barrel fold metal-dependent hydrolase
MNRRELIVGGTILAARPRLGFGQSSQAAGTAPESSPGEQAGTPPSKILLSDYLPHSIYKIPESQVPRAKFPVFDGHDHGRGPLSVDEMVRIMDKVGVEKSVIFTGAGTADKFKEIAGEYSKYPDRFEPWCVFDLRGITEKGLAPNSIQSLEECRRAGAKGVGELHDKGRGMFYGQPHAPTPAQLRIEKMPLNDGPAYTRPPVPPNPKAPLGPHPDDPRLDPLWERAGQLGMPISFHTSDPIWSYLPMDNTNDGLMNGWTWRIVLEPGTYDHDQLVTSLENTVKKHPGTQFVACHLMNLDYDLDRLAGMFDRYPNLNADIAARFSETATIPRYMHRFLTKYSDRIVYGTDVDYDESFFAGTLRILETEDEHFYLRGKMGSANFNFNYHWPSYGFGLPNDVLKKIYRDNMVNIMARAERKSA